MRLPPQRLGAQTQEVLTEMGFGPAEIEALAEDKVDQAARAAAWRLVRPLAETMNHRAAQTREQAA